MTALFEENGLCIPGTVARHEPSDRNWSRLGEFLEPHYEGGLFTILHVDRARALVRRAYSSNPVDYAVGGTKALMGTAWAQQVIHEGRCLIATTAQEMEAAFADHRTLIALGCTRAMNIPLRQGIDVAWTVNLLRGGEAYTPEECAAAKARIEAWVDERYPESRLSRSV